MLAALASPTVASAAGLAAASSKAAAGSPALQLAALGGGAALGALGGAAGILFSARQILARARDEEERRHLRRFTAANLAAVGIAASSFPIVGRLTQSPWGPVTIFVAFVATLALLQLLWLPKIVKRRLEAEKLEDPIRYAAERKRARRYAILGWSLGLLGGSAGLVAGLWRAAGY